MVCLQLDLARQKESLAFIRDYFKKAKSWGCNTILLYLENAVKTSVTSEFSADETYSEDEIRKIVSFGEEFGLDVVPAFENLGHLEKFFAYESWRDLSECKNEQTEGRGFDPEPYGSCGCPSNEKLYEKTDEYIKEVASLFKSEYVHAGLDEVFDMGVCPKCRKRIENGESKADIFLKHVLHTYDLIKSLGKTMMMWDDFFEYVDIVEKLPRDIILCNWNYGFIDYEPRGHWTGRIKKDWFGLYDKLGFRYLYCVYAHRASSRYNADSFYRYAKKYKPFGAICTAWCRQDSFYFGAYPFMAYCGSLFSGNLGGTDSDREAAAEKIYEKILKNKELARIISSLTVVDTGRNERVSQVAECRYFSLEAYESQLKNAIREIENDMPSGGVAYLVASDIRDYISEIYQGQRLNFVANEVMDRYEAGKDTQDLADELDGIMAEYKRIYENKRKLWEKYRSGIKSEGNALDKKYDGIIRRIEEEKKILGENKRRMVIALEQMSFDAFGTPKCTIEAGYKGEKGGEEIIFDGSLKPSTVAFEQSGCYYHRFAVEPKEIEYILLDFRGESESYPQYISFVLNGKKYVPATVEKICGEVTDEKNLLENDTRFARFGCSDGLKHFNDIDLAKKNNVVKITFKEF